VKKSSETVQARKLTSDGISDGI